MHKLQSALADSVRFNDLMVNGGASNELKIHVLKDLKAQQTMAGMSPVSSTGGLPVSGSSTSSVVTGTPMWNNLFDLPGMKPDGSSSCDLVVAAAAASTSSLGDSGNLSGSTVSSAMTSGGLNSSTASSSISNSNNNNNNNNSNNEDSYEAGIADDMRELALRLESELNIN